MIRIPIKIRINNEGVTHFEVMNNMTIPEGVYTLIRGESIIDGDDVYMKGFIEYVPKNAINN